MPDIHKTAIVSEYAKLEEGVIVGPYSIIEGDVKIGKNTKIGSWVLIKAYSEIGEDCVIHSGVVIGEIPQHRDFRGEISYVVIGKKNIIREFVTIHRAVGEGNLTKVGDNNFIMANAHIAHNCKINNNIVITNFAGLTGHVEIEDYSTISGLVAIHQFVRIGRLAMVGGASKVVKDVPPYLLANGHPAQVYGLNFVGLRRHNIKNEKISILKEAFRIIYKSGLTISKALQRLETLPQIEEIQHLINFIKQSKRGICRGSAKISSQLLPATEI